MSVCRRASFQSGTEIVYRSHFLSGLGVGDPTCRMFCWSRKVIGRLPSGAWAVAMFTEEASATVTTVATGMAPKCRERGDIAALRSGRGFEGVTATEVTQERVEVLARKSG